MVLTWKGINVTHMKRFYKYIHGLISGFKILQFKEIIGKFVRDLKKNHLKFTIDEEDG